MSPAPNSDPDRAWLATLTVLYVEDDGLARAELSRFMGRRVHRVLEAADGVEGLAQFRAERPALVLTDISMSSMDGLTMTEEVRRLDPSVPIVVITAFERVDYLERSIDAGVDKFVTKPVDLEKLDAVLLVCARRLRGEALVASEREHELQRARAREREVVGHLAGGMAHDFNNLLQSVLGNVSLAADLGTLTRDQHELLEQAVRSAEEAGQLGKRLLALAEASFGNFSVGDLSPVLRRSVARALRGSATEARVTVADDLPELWFDRELLGETFANLASNAREAMAERGLLEVRAELRELRDGEHAELRAGPYVAVTFRDEGCGIPADVLPKIFDPYFSTKPRGATHGVGLGLSLALALARQHGGVVHATSTPGAGAVFTVLLPTSPTSPTLSTVAPAARQRG